MRIRMIGHLNPEYARLSRAVEFGSVRASI